MNTVNRVKISFVMGKYLVSLAVIYTAVICKLARIGNGMHIDILWFLIPICNWYVGLQIGKKLKLKTTYAFLLSSLLIMVLYTAFNISTLKPNFSLIKMLSILALGPLLIGIMYTAQIKKPVKFQMPLIADMLLGAAWGIAIVMGFDILYPGCGKHVVLPAFSACTLAFVLALKHLEVKERTKQLFACFICSITLFLITGPRFYKTRFAKHLDYEKFLESGAIIEDKNWLAPGLIQTLKLTSGKRIILANSKYAYSIPSPKEHH